MRRDDRNVRWLTIFGPWRGLLMLIMKPDIAELLQETLVN